MRVIRDRSRRLQVTLAAALLVLPVLWTGCGVRDLPPHPLMVSGGDEAKGRVAIEKYGCGACHLINGVPGARGEVGPPLNGLGSRHTIAGVLANDPQNLIHWIQDPQGIVPGNAMPNMGVTDEDARNIAAYLYTLK